MKTVNNYHFERLNTKFAISSDFLNIFSLLKFTFNEQTMIIYKQ